MAAISPYFWIFSSKLMKLMALPFLTASAGLRGSPHTRLPLDGRFDLIEGEQVEALDGELAEGDLPHEGVQQIHRLVGTAEQTVPHESVLFHQKAHRRAHPDIE